MACRSSDKQEKWRCLRPAGFSDLRAACAYHLKDREAWIGWDAQTCARRRNLIINNVRFLVRAAARRPNLASKALAEALKAIGAQWRERFGYEPLLAEPSGAR